MGKVRGEIKEIDFMHEEGLEECSVNYICAKKDHEKKDGKDHLNLKQ